jgi:hypothetical protein
MFKRTHTCRSYPTLITSSGYSIRPLFSTKLIKFVVAWEVVLKSLCVIHRLLRDAPSSFAEDLCRRKEILNKVRISVLCWLCELQAMVLQKSGPGFKIKVKPGSSAKPALNLLKTGV